MVTGFECVDHFVFRYFVCLIFTSVFVVFATCVNNCIEPNIASVCLVVLCVAFQLFITSLDGCIQLSFVLLASVENMGLSRNLIVHKDWVSIDSIPEPVVFAPSLGKGTADLFIARCFALLRCLLLVLRPLLLVALLNAKIAPLHCFLPVALLDALM